MLSSEITWSRLNNAFLGFMKHIFLHFTMMYFFVPENSSTNLHKEFSYKVFDLTFWSWKIITPFQKHFSELRLGLCTRLHWLGDLNNLLDVLQMMWNQACLECLSSQYILLKWGTKLNFWQRYCNHILKKLLVLLIMTIYIS